MHNRQLDAKFAAQGSGGGAISRVIASSFAMCAFAVALITGLAAENSMAQILLRALLALIICYFLGLFAGLLCTRVINEHVQSVKRKHGAASAENSEVLRMEAPTVAAEEEAIIV